MEHLEIRRKYFGKIARLDCGLRRPNLGEEIEYDVAQEYLNIRLTGVVQKEIDSHTYEVLITKVDIDDLR